MSKVVLNRGSAAPGLPSAGKVALYLDTDNLVKAKTDDGTVYILDLPQKGIEFFNQVGVSPLEIWHGLGLITGGTRTRAIAKDTLQAVPFYSGRAGTIDRIGIHVTVAGTVVTGTGKARLGIYRNTSGTVLYPSTLLIDAGEVVVTSTGVKTITIDQALPRNALLWAALNHDCDLSNPTVKSMAEFAQNALLGFQSTAFDPMSTHLETAVAYAVLADPFPAGATIAASDSVIMAVRYSA